MAREHVVRTGGEHPSVAVFRRRGVLLRETAVPVAFAGGGIVMVLLVPGPVAIVGWFVALFFGSIVVLAVRLVLDTRPAVVVDRSGITDRSSVIPGGFLPWSNITGTAVLTMGRQQGVCVYFRDPRPVLARVGDTTRVLMRANIRLTGTPVTIVTTALPLSAGELVAEMAAFAPPPPATPPAAPSEPG